MPEKCALLDCDKNAEWLGHGMCPDRCSALYRCTEHKRLSQYRTYLFHMFRYRNPGRRIVCPHCRETTPFPFVEWEPL